MVVRVFHAVRFCCGLLFSQLSFSVFTYLWSVFFLLNGQSFISVCFYLLLTLSPSVFILLHFFPGLKVAQSSTLSFLFGDTAAVVAAC